MIDFSYTLSKLLPIVPHFFWSIALGVILTPIVNKIAYKYKALDIKSDSPIRVAKYDSEKNVIPRLGGLAVSVVFLLMIFLIYGFNAFTILMGLSVLILTVAGFLDDIYDLPAWLQFLLQFLAVALIVIVAGVRIESIDIINLTLDFSAWEYFFNHFGILYRFVFPADIITILWILVIINAMNWVAGIDALEEMMSIVAGITLSLIAIKLNRLEFVPMILVFTGALSGFTVFNLPPAKIYSGTIGNILYGFLLSVFAIEIDGKMTTSILLLAIPLVDFVWVLIGRLVSHRQYNPIKLMSISGKHHLHHRLQEMGFSNWRVLIFELSLFLVFASFAYLTAGFNISVVAGLLAFAILVILFAYLNFKNKTKAVKMKESKIEIQRLSEIKQTPDREYRY